MFLFTLRAHIVFFTEVYYALVFYFFLDYASSFSKSLQSSCHYGSVITHASPTQRSAKEFVDPFSFGMKSRDHGYEVSLGPTHLQARTCQQSRTSGHRSSFAGPNREFGCFRGSFSPLLVLPVANNLPPLQALNSHLTNLASFAS